MNRIYSCPVCTKASYSYGTCSDECESKLPEIFEKENAKPDIFTKVYDFQNENALLKIRIAELEKENQYKQALYDQLTERTAKAENHLSKITAAHEAFYEEIRNDYYRYMKSGRRIRLIVIDDVLGKYTERFDFIHLAEQVRQAKLSAGVEE